MQVTLGIGEVFALMGAFAVVLGAAGKLLLAQFEKTLEARFAEMERSRAESSNTWTQRFDELRKASAQEIEHWHRVERDLMALKVELPREYMRREDHIRFETTIIAKLDALNTRLDLLTEREGRKN